MEKIEQEIETKSDLNFETGKIDFLNSDEYEDEEDSEYSVEERKKMEEFYESSIKNFKAGEIVKGQIVKILEDGVLIDVGFKSEGIIPLSEFPKRGVDLKINDKVEVFLQMTENKDGMIVLSKEKANRIKVWEKVSKAFDDGETIEGVVSAKIKGGLTVDIGLKAFLPGSHIDIRAVRNLDKIIGQTLKLKIIKIDKQRGNIVLSRKILLEEERKETRGELLKSLEEGKIVEGIVKNITDYGTFIDLGGIDGLLHIIDMSWGRVNHPSELFAIGDQIKVIVLKYDKENGKVSLGFKQISEDPWSKIDEKFKVGSRVRGKVVNIAYYGAFIEIEEGVEGLVHISEMSWNKYLKHPSKIVAIGDIVDAEVLDVDKEKKRISLGMKQIEQNPWDNIEEKYPIGSQIEGVVRNITHFGAFVELEEGVDGLIHVSDMVWIPKMKHPSEVVKKRDKVKAVVLNVDRENKRLSLGMKQLEEDPWKTVENKYAIGQDIKCKIIKITNFGAFVEFEDGLEGLIHLSQLASKKITNADEVVAIDDEVMAKIVKINVEERKLGLSIKAYEENMGMSEIEREISKIEKEKKIKAKEESSEEVTSSGENSTSKKEDD